MTSKIIADSCCDLSKQLQINMNVDLVPFKITVGDGTYIDDEHINTIRLLDATISSALSGAYNSAMTARNMFAEISPDKSIHIFDSLSASTGEVLVALKINECIKKDLSNAEIISTVTAFINDMKTFFILDSLDNLIKNGRISKLKGFIANVLNIVPIMKAEGGVIDLHEKARGSKKAFHRLVEIIGENGSNFKNKTLCITHCNALDKAESLKEDISKKYNFNDILILETKGLSTMYAYDGGVIISF